MTLATDNTAKILVDFTAEDIQKANDFCKNFRSIKPNPIRSEDVETHWQLAGKLGEIAIGKLTGLPVNFEIFNHADTGDFKLSSGRTLSVRAIQVHSRMDYPFKVIVREGEIHSDLICLVLIAPTMDYAIVDGYIEMEEFLKIATPENEWEHQGSNKLLTVSRDKLKPFDVSKLLRSYNELSLPS